MKKMIPNLLLALSFSISISGIILAEEPAQKNINKLREMYSFYYLPFNVHFKEGAQIDDVFPVVPDKLGALSEIVLPDNMRKVEQVWEPIRETWKNKSLFLTTSVPLGKKIKISQHLISHKIPVSRNAMDHLSLADKILLQESLKGKSPELQANVTQLRFLKSFLDPEELTNFNFFIIAPSWCSSSKEYLSLFESYFKKFPNTHLSLHSVVIEDPNELIFDSKIFKELFPNTKKYSHEIVPRFLAIEQVEGKSIIYEEGEALAVLYERFFHSHRGFLNNTVAGALPNLVKDGENPFLSSSLAKIK
ncbi:MAG: hypothetical protein NT000_01030 [Proteobacteria bacterium]|nr:hypothetical protein [Pseudomonadota bacterium]